MVSRAGCCDVSFRFISMESWLTLGSTQAGSREGGSWAPGA